MPANSERSFMKRTILSAGTVVSIAVIVLMIGAGLAIAAEVVVEKGKTVKVHYTLTVEGEVVDTSQGRGPLEFKVGEGAMIPGFEKGVLGMKKGQKKTFGVSPEEGYGKVDPKGFQEVARDRLPKDREPKAGDTLYFRRPEGGINQVKITEVKKDKVIVDFNHPLAGKSLKFDVEVVDIQ